VAVVHNGIIENHIELRKRLEGEGYVFSSETDTEVIPHLIEMYLEENVAPLCAIRRVCEQLTGAYALGILFSNFPDDIWGVRWRSPLIVAEGEGGYYLASDVPALAGVAERVYYLGEGEVAHLTPRGVTFYSLEGEEIHHAPTPISVDAGEVGHTGYDTYMEKELFEIPSAVRRTIGEAKEKGLSPLAKDTDGIYILACGSAYHVGMVGKYLIEEKVGIPVVCEVASEVRYRTPPLTTRPLALAISQSGETADTLEAVRQMKGRGVGTLGIVNVRESSMARECADVLYTQAGREMAVATTKAYCAQVGAIYQLTSQMLLARGKQEAGRELAKEVMALSYYLENMLARRGELEEYAHFLAKARNIFYIGRGADYAVCMEGALKMREITYIHAEAYAAGELKHGTISLIEKGVPVVAVLTQPHVAEKTMSAMEEVRARGAQVLVIQDKRIPFDKRLGDVFTFSSPSPDTAPLVAAVAMQMLAYMTCREMGLDPDQPRNLAKSVTVE
jgi:glucosamine--fructose-6-phosphate aminotransferase (isomerizing)